MAIVEKTMDTAGGAVGGGVKGALFGALTSVAVGAVVVGAAMATLGAVLGGLPVALGLGAAGALGGAVIGALPSFSIPLAGWGAAIGGIGGGAKGLMGKGKEKEAPSIDEQIATERARGDLLKTQAANQPTYTAPLTAQIEERQKAASSFDNPDATTGFAAKASASTPTQTVTVQADKNGFVAKTQTSANDATVAQRA